MVRGSPAPALIPVRRARANLGGVSSTLAPRVALRIVGFLVIGILGDGKSVRLACPRAGVDQLAALGAEWPPPRGRRPFDGLAAVRAGNEAWFAQSVHTASIGQGGNVSKIYSTTGVLFCDETKITASEIATTSCSSPGLVNR